MENISKQKKINFIHTVLTSLLTLFACGPSEEDYDSNTPQENELEPISNLYPYPPETSLNCPKGTLVSYENFGAGFLSQYCQACHSRKKPEKDRAGAPGDVNFDIASDAQFFRVNILARTKLGSAKPMPPNRDIPKHEILILSEWLECGAPEKNK